MNENIDRSKNTAMTVCRVITFIIFFVGYVVTLTTGPLSAVNASMKSTPNAILICAIVGSSLLFFPRAEGTVRQGVYPGLFSRYLAANIDLIIAMLLMFSILFPVLLLIENTARDEWAWSWEEAQSPFYLPSLFIGILTCFSGLYFYFRIHLERGRATPGQYILGYKIEPVGAPNYNRRIWNSLFWLWLWIFAWAARTETEGVYSWDKNSNSKAVRVS